VVGRRFADLPVLQLCAAWERAFDWQARQPAVHAAA
jgi:Asp-tRNA(Asn)/Glu-tRNA(Gln) amidotransferase A subunit family amidase